MSCQVLTCCQRQVLSRNLPYYYWWTINKHIFNPRRRFLYQYSWRRDFRTFTVMSTKNNNRYKRTAQSPPSKLDNLSKVSRGNEKTTEYPLETTNLLNKVIEQSDIELKKQNIMTKTLITVLETPDKSASDNKSYRYVNEPRFFRFFFNYLMFQNYKIT